ncbi:MAG: hypothetical protein GF317_24385, partial [Candidatus Lokiarchaeota archaeon]|nr:hypothetical protein [Candidatus Lokiarchaeota archaeon]MBD3202512.1 hypothetical protein [Candidatus Lokiarchaeota archaeon]
IPIIESPASAESQCAYLVRNGISDYSNSQDFDSMVFGCPYLIQNLSKSLRRKNHGRWTYKKIDPLLIDLKENLNRLEINQFQLVDLVLLLKTDYFSGVKGIGPKTALNLIKKHNNIETIMRKERKEYNFSEINPDLIAKIRKIYLLPEVIDSFDDLMWNPPDRNRIFYLMCNDHNLNKERVKSNINKVIDNFYKTLKHFQFVLNQPKSVQKTLDMVFS